MLVAAVLVGLVARATAPQVDFAYDSTRLKGITIDGACILGDEVRTGGGYLIGSADGSDAQGRGIISVGASGGRMKSDNPKTVAAPPFKFSFSRQGQNRLGFSVSVGPVTQDFATISLPFDFGLKAMDRFSFAGDSYQVFCAENDGSYRGSGNRYAAIRPKCEIRDIAQRLVGKVGGASTEAPSVWGEVDGPYATVRISVDASTHYQKLVFMNHPGTHNLEFSFGKMRVGDTASLSGQILVTPKAGPDRWEYDGITEFNHQIGRAEGDGWSVRVGDERERYMCFGPYATEVGAGRRVATFSAMLDNVTAESPAILTFDVADAASGAVLAKRDVFRADFSQPMQYQDFALPFNAPRGSRLEFRTLWHGVSYARLKNVIVTRQ